MSRGGAPTRARRRGRAGAQGGSVRGRGRANTTTVPDASTSISMGRTARQAAEENPAEATTSRLPRVVANIHPGQIVRDNTQKRRSSEQVKQDKAKAAEAAASKIKDQEKRAQETVRRLAAAEDRVHQQELEYSQHAARPDLQFPALPPKKKSKLLKGNEHGFEYIRLPLTSLKIVLSRPHTRVRVLKV